MGGLGQPQPGRIQREQHRSMFGMRDTLDQVVNFLLAERAPTRSVGRGNFLGRLPKGIMATDQGRGRVTV
jgi:hypothetical protein